VPAHCARSGARIAPAFWMTVLALVIVAIGVLPAAGDPVPSRPAASIPVRVSAADTLWSIAQSHRLPGLSNAQMVALIEGSNALTGVLEPGTVLWVPAEPSTQTSFAQVTEVQGTD
jgi:Tfp pilus assembly protein FimV